MLPERYGAVEPEARLVDEAVEHELGRELLAIKKPTIVHNDQFEFPRLREKYDFALANSIFSHASLGQIGHCLERLHEVLADDGVFVATWCPVPWLCRKLVEYDGDQWVYPGVTFYKTSTIRRVARERGFRYQPIAWNTFMGFQVWGAFTKGPRAVPRRDAAASPAPSFRSSCRPGPPLTAIHSMPSSKSTESGDASSGQSTASRPRWKRAMLSGWRAARRSRGSPLTG